MTKVIVLGGCGAVGSNAVKTLVNTDVFSEVVIGDFNIEKAEQMAAEIGLKVSARKFDAMNAQSCKDAITGCDLVLNCVGPFYSTVKTILTAAIKSGINYVDICDDPDVTLEILGMDEDAKKAGKLKREAGTGQKRLEAAPGKPKFNGTARHWAKPSTGLSRWRQTRGPGRTN